jgi:RNA polymerase sigma factor (sigma-70 family)
MSRHRLATPELERIFQGETVSGLSEWQLLVRYLEHRDELAFAALVARHGPMVMGTCRRMLSGGADAEDAFQATFLVLVRRARTLGPRDAIGPWLHGVAARVSMRARAQAARRRRLEPSGGELNVFAAAAEPDAELAAIVDEEVSRLPEKYRLPILLCYVQGLTHEEAARQLEWPVGSVKGRLARARDLLRGRLLRRGIAPAAAILGSSIAREACAALDRTILEQTVRNCMKITLGQASVDAVSISIASLVKGALSAMIVEKMKWAAFAVLAGGVTLAGAAVMARQPGPPARPRTPARNPSLVDNRLNRADSDSANKPGEKAITPENTSAELEDLRGRLIQAARRDWTAALQDFRANKAPLDRIYQASLRVMAAEEDGKGSVADQSAASAHAERMRDVARIQHANPSRSESQVSLVNAYSAEAELWRARAAVKFRSTGKSLISTPAGKGARESSDRAGGEAGLASKTTPRQGQDPRSQLIIGKLEESVVMKFVEETPLEEIIKHIRDSTKSSDMPSGIPIYVDPAGLSEADKTMSSTIRNLELDGVPLRRTLQLALAQLDLGYFIVDGMLYITSLESAQSSSLPPSMPMPSPHMEQLEQAERGELTLDEMKELVEKLKARKEIEELQHGGDGVWAGPGPPPNNPSPEELKQNKELIQSLSKLTHSLLEELKDLKNTKQPEKAEKALAPPNAVNHGRLQ